MVYRWDFISDEVRAAADGLPFEGALALMELLAAAALDPWGVAGRDPERDGNMPPVPFGSAGMVSLLILDGPRRVWVTQVTWGGDG